MMRSALYQTNTLNWIFIVLADRNVTSLGHIILIQSRPPWSYEFTTTYAISDYHHWCCEFESRSGRGVQDYVIKVCQWLTTPRWFFPGPPVSSANKSDLHDITEILLKVALSNIKQTKNFFYLIWPDLTWISKTSLNY